jgi:hypothetical protein
MNIRSVGSIRLSTSVLVAMLFLVPVLAPAQNNMPKKGTKAMATRVFEGEMMDEHCAHMGGHEATMKAEKLATPELCTMYCIYFQKTPGT